MPGYPSAERRPATGQPNTRKAARTITAWDAKAINAFLTHVQATDPGFHAFAVLAFHTGLRRGELLALVPADVEIRDGSPIAVNVNHAITLDSKNQPQLTVPKSKKSRRRVPLTAQAQQAVSALPFSFSGDHATKNFNRLVETFMASRKPASRPERITLHGARHSFVSNLLAKGTPIATVSKLAGHSSVAFTVDTYGHLIPSDADDAVLGLYG